MTDINLTQEEPIWNSAESYNYPVENETTYKIKDKIRLIENELNELEHRIETELDLTDKILSKIKLKSEREDENTNYEINEMKRQLETTDYNLKSFKKLKEPRLNELRVLKKKLYETYENLRNDNLKKYKELISDGLESTLESAKALNKDLAEIFRLHKTLIKIEHESKLPEQFAGIIPKDIYLPDKYLAFLEKYLTKISELANTNE